VPQVQIPFWIPALRFTGAARFGHVPVIKTLLESKAQLHQRLKGAGAHGMGCNGGADQHR